MRIGLFLIIGSILSLFSITSCCTGKKNSEMVDVAKYTITFQKGHVPKVADFAPSYLLKDAKKVNKTINEWLITLQNGEKSLEVAHEFLSDLDFVVKISAKSEPKTSTTSSKKSKTNIIK